MHMKSYIGRLAASLRDAQQKFSMNSTARKTPDQDDPRFLNPPELQMHKIDKISEFYAERTRTDGGDFSAREDDVRTIVETLETLAGTFAHSADKWASKKVVFELNSAMNLNVSKLATARELPNSTGFKVQLSLLMVDLLMEQVKDVASIPKKSYRVRGVVLLAAFAVVSHELSHVAYGHLPPLKNPELSSSEISRAIECDADFRAGQTMPAIYLNEETRPIVEKFGGIENPGDFCEAAYLGILLLCVVLQTADNSERQYHRPSTRWKVFQKGFGYSLACQNPDFGLVAAASVLRAQHLIERLPLSAPKWQLTAVLTQDDEDWKAYNEVTMPLLTKLHTDLNRMPNVPRRR